MTKPVAWISPAEAELAGTESLVEIHRLLQFQICPDAARHQRNMDRSLRNVTNEIKRRLRAANTEEK